VRLTREEIKKGQATLARYRKDGVLYFKNVLGVEHLEGYQERVIRTVDENERTAIRACHDVGKSFLMARIAIKFLTTYPNSKVITTAPTFNQVEKILWSEIRSAAMRAKFPLGGKLNLTDWTFSPDWFAIGVSPRKEASEGEGQGTQSSFQGFHAAYLLVIFDEATGIPPALWTMVEGLLTSAHVKFVAIGNPTSTASEFYHCFKSRSWAKVSLSCFDSPNLIANGITNKEELQREIDYVKTLPDVEAQRRLDSYKVVRPYLLTTKWVVTNVTKWGMDHPLTVSKVFGEFPRGGDNTLFPLDVLEASQRRTHKFNPETERKTIGVDVARFGSDATVLTGLAGKQQVKLAPFYKNDSIQVTGEVINLAREMGGVDVIVVDETGVGSGVVDNLRAAVERGDLPQTTEIRGVQFGEKADQGDKELEEVQKNLERFANIKARMFGLLGDDMKDPNGLALLDENIYLEEGPTIRFKYDEKGRMVILSKDQYRKLYNRKSPDHMDSLALANYGRYDELGVGSFTSAFTSANEATTTIAGGLRSDRNY